MGVYFDPVLFVAVSVAALLFAALRGRSRGLVPAAARWGPLTAVAIVVATRLTRLVAGHVTSPPEWDFMAFWMWGQILTSGGSPYVLADLAGQPLPMAPSPEFVREVVQTGCPYPPITLPLLVPLGWVGFREALAGWYGVQLAALGGSIVLLARMFTRAEGWFGLALTALLVALFFQTPNTLHAGQTNSIVLLLVLVMLRDWRRRRAGVWMSLAIAVKPFVGFIAVWFIARRRWKPIAAAVAAGLVLMGLSWLIVGHDVFISYFSEGPVGRYPGWVLSHPVNQSLLGEIVRRMGTHAAGFPLYLALCAGVLAVTLSSIARLGEAEPVRSFSLVLITGLVAYPAALSHYSMLVLIPILWLWRERDRLPGGAVATAALLVAVYAFTEASIGQLYVNLALWACLLVVRDGAAFASNASRARWSGDAPARGAA